MFPRVFLKKKEENEIQQGFPWVFDNEINSVKFEAADGKGVVQTSLADCAVENGSLVEVFASAGGFLGSGIINRNSKITVRLLGGDHADKIAADTNGFIEKRISDAVSLRNLYYKKEDSYRLIYGESDFLPGLIAERYCDINGDVFLVVQFLSLCVEVFREEIISALKKIVRPKGIYERSDVAVRQKEGLEERTGWLGEKFSNTVIICENGIDLEVDIAAGQKTGYFLDQKFNRLAVSELSKNRRVLDTFTHTGAFGLNAVKGGAKEVLSIDISEDAVKMVRRNIELNDKKFNASSVMRAECADVFDVLKKFQEENEKFDLIILDPPAFTKSAKNIEKAYGGYKEINLRAMKIIERGGILVTCSCSYFFDEIHFYGMIMKAAEDAKRKVQILAKYGAGPDHPVLAGYPKSEYLKCAVCRVL